jgi:hypothetical protein
VKRALTLSPQLRARGLGAISDMRAFSGVAILEPDVGRFAYGKVEPS